eukprot:961813-Rhodomonas_salina.3
MHATTRRRITGRALRHVNEAKRIPGAKRHIEPPLRTVLLPSTFVRGSPLPLFVTVQCGVFAADALALELRSDS